MAIDWQPFVDRIQQHETFVLTSHMRPDCDALGSELGLAFALRALGKKVRIVNGDPTPPHIAFIDPENEILVLDRDVSAAELTCDALIVLDTSAWSQLGPMADVVRNTTACKIVIDHHPSEDDLGAEKFKETTAEANGRLVLEAIDALGVSVTEAMAVPLFAAIATDTGWFRFASVGEATYTAVARLVHAGANPSAIFSALYEKNTVARLLLQGRMLGKVQSDLDGRLMFSSVTLADLAATGAEPTDTEDVINRLLSVAGVEVALIFLELDPKETKVSLRSRSSINVSQIAQQFGGGGHVAASGIRYQGSIDAAQSAILEAVRGEVRFSDPGTHL